MKRPRIAFALALALAAPSLASPGAASTQPQGRYALQDARSGRTVTAAAFRGRPQLIFFGFTRCRLVCPLGLKAMAETLRALGPGAAGVAALFITLDPERDSAAQLREYAASFHPDIHPLRGGRRATDAALKAFRLQAERFGDSDEGGFQFDHPSLFFLLDGQGRFVKSLSSSLPPQDLAKELRPFLPPL